MLKMKLKALRLLLLTLVFQKKVNNLNMALYHFNDKMNAKKFQLQDGMVVFYLKDRKMERKEEYPTRMVIVVSNMGDLGVMYVNAYSSNNAVVLHKQFEDDVVFSFWMLEYEFFQFEITNGFENIMLENLEDSEIYDKLWFFEKNVFFSKFLRNISFTCSNKESIQMKW